MTLDVRCQIHFYSTKSRRELIHMLAAVTGWSVASDAHVFTLQHGACYFGIARGEDGYIAQPGEPIAPGDFRAFPYFVDITSDGLAEAADVELTRVVLEAFWSRGIPAVAVASFEGELPSDQESRVPFPTLGAAVED